MTFPAGLTLVTVGIQFDVPPSGGAVGRVRFQSTQPLLGAADNSIVPPDSWTVELNSTGGGSVLLPATNDPDWIPTGWAYQVYCDVNGVLFKGTLQLDYQTTSVQLADLLQVNGAAVAGSSYAPLSSFTTLAATVAALGVRVTTIENNAQPTIGFATVMNRIEVNSTVPLSSGQLHVSHFTADRTQAITKLRTFTAETAGVGATHAWIGVLSWDGTNYTPVVSSVDDPTRWASTYASYTTPMQTTFNMVYGQDYAIYKLWIGSGSAPVLSGSVVFYADGRAEKVLNGILNSQTQQPTAPIPGAFFGTDYRMIQTHLVP